MRLNPYLNFNGDCREAMTFYKECLNADLTLQTMGEAPLATQTPEEDHERIMHAILSKEDTVLMMASDTMHQNAVIKGNNNHLSLNCTSEEEIRRIFEKLSAGGTVSQPLEDTFWGAIFGMFTDKFGMHWLLNYTKPTNA